MGTETKVVSAAEALERIETAGKAAKQEVRRILKMSPGQVVRQGDIYIHCVKLDHPRGDKLKSKQLALGSSMGSKHFAEAPAICYAGTKLPEWCDSRTFLGPLVVSRKRFTVSHYEHAHCEFPAGTFQVTHQMDANTMERVVD